MFKNFLTFSFVIVLLFTSSKAWTDYLTFDCFNYQIREVNEDQSYIITWSGDSLYSNCKIGFHAYDSDHILNNYKICITATNWDIADRNVALKYYTGIADYLRAMFTKSSYDSPTTKWCSDAEDYVDIELKTADSGYNQGRLTLKVEGVMTYNYYNTISWTIGAAVGVVVIVSIIVVVLIVVACRRRTVRSTIYRPGISPNTVITQYGPQQIEGGYLNQGYFVGPPPYTDTTKANYPVHSQKPNTSSCYPQYQGSSQPPPSYQQYQAFGNTQQPSMERQRTPSTVQPVTTEQQESSSTQETSQNQPLNN